MLFPLCRRNSIDGVSLYVDEVNNLSLQDSPELQVG